VHRDVKPANIFLSPDGRAQLGDFGIAQIDDVSGRTLTTIGHPGTPIYMSPEQAGTTAYLSPAADQYSLGLVLFEMLTGRAYRRLRKPEVTDLLAAQPSPVAALIERMTAPDPEDRYPSMRDAGVAITAIERMLDAEAETPSRLRFASQPPGAPVAAPENTTHVLTASLGNPSTPPPAPPPVINYPQPAPQPLPSQRFSRRAFLTGLGGLAAGILDEPGGGVGAKRESSDSHELSESLSSLAEPAAHVDAASALCWRRALEGLLGDLVQRTNKDLAVRLPALVKNSVPRPYSLLVGG